MNAGFVKRVLEGVAEITETQRKLFREQYGAEPPGARRPDDLEFVMWFEQQRMANPNWLNALPFVDGGREELQRYKRIVVRMLEGVAEEVA